MPSDIVQLCQAAFPFSSIIISWTYLDGRNAYYLTMKHTTTNGCKYMCKGLSAAVTLSRQILGRLGEPGRVGRAERVKKSQVSRNSEGSESEPSGLESI